MCVSPESMCSAVFLWTTACFHLSEVQNKINSLGLQSEPENWFHQVISRVFNCSLQWSGARFIRGSCCLWNTWCTSPIWKHPNESTSFTFSALAPSSILPRWFSNGLNVLPLYWTQSLKALWSKYLHLLHLQVLAILWAWRLAGHPPHLDTAQICVETWQLLR